MAGFSKTQLLRALHICAGFVHSGTELLAVVFSQRVNPILILVIFFSWNCLKDKLYNSKHQTEEIQENILFEIANIPAKQLQGIFNTFCDL
jgi:hypothetical protein